MRPGVFLFLAAGLLAGCGLQSSTSHTSPTPSSTKSHTSSASPRSTTAPDPYPTRAPVPTLGPARVTAGMSAYQKGLAYIRVRDYRAAAKQFRASLQSHQNVTESYVGLGASALASGDYLNAYRSYALASARAPRNLSYLYAAAVSAYYAGDYHDSIPYATRFIALQPRNPVGYRLRLEDYQKLAMAKQQLKDARVVAGLQPSIASVQNDLAIAYSNNRHYQQSLHAFSRAIQLDPSVGQYYSNRATVELFLKQTAAAVRDFKKASALARDPVTRQRLDAAVKALEKTGSR